MKKITIEVTEEQHKEILGIIKPKSVKPWRAEVGGEHWTVNSNGYVSWYLESGDTGDNHRYLTSNYYRTQEEAQQALERQKAIGRVTHRIYELNDGWEPDWSDENQEKYNIHYDHEVEEFDWSIGRYLNPQFILPNMASQEIANQIIAEMKDDLRLIWGL